MDTQPSSTSPLHGIAKAEYLLRRRYEIASIVNDVLIAAWFIAGSIMYFSDSTAILGTWMFLIGSIELAIRPTIRLVRHLHLHRTTRRAGSHESGQDF
jgi:hypothetical protein